METRFSLHRRDTQLFFWNKEKTLYILRKEPIQICMEFFVLLEHKSSHDKHLFSQLLRYQVLIREHIIRQKGFPQPVIPVVFYHGKEPVKWGKSLQEEDFKTFFSRIHEFLSRYRQLINGKGGLLK